MNEEQIIAAAWDLVNDDLERSVQDYKILKEAGGSSAATLLKVAHAINDPRAVGSLADSLHDDERAI